MKREILVTGAAGRVGSHLVKKLLRKGYAVRAFVLQGDNLINRLDGLECKIYEGDLTCEADVKNAVSPAVDDLRSIPSLWRWQWL